MPAIATRAVTFTPLILDGVGPPAVATGYFLVTPTASYRDGVGRVAPLPLQVAIDGVAVTCDLPVTGVGWALKVAGTFVGLTGESYTTVEYVTIPAGTGALEYEDLPRVDPVNLTSTGGLTVTALTIAQGTDSGVRWAVNDGTTGLPYDLTGWTVRSQVRASIGATDVLHEWSTALGNATVGADGYVTLTWSAAETSTWGWVDGIYDIELTTPIDHNIIRLASGRVTVSREITR